MITNMAICAMIEAAAILHGADPAFCKAVARIEPGTKSQQFRIGPASSGKFYAPFNIHKDYLKKWRIDILEVNVEVGVKALKGKNKRQVLKWFNPQFNEKYYTEVMKLTKQYQRGKS